MGWLRGCVDVWDQASLFGSEVLEVNKDESDDGSEKLCEANLGVADKIAGELICAGHSLTLKTGVYS